MKTLGKNITSNWFKTEEDYNKLEAQWSEYVRSPEGKNIKAEHIIIYQALRGKDWMKGFAKVTNKVKLENGGFYDWGVLKAIGTIHSRYSKSEELLEPFCNLVTFEMLTKVKAFITSYTDMYNGKSLESYNSPTVIEEEKKNAA